MGNELKKQHIVAALDTIMKLTMNGTALDIKLTSDMITHAPVLKVGRARIGDRGNFLKAEHIETFVGKAAVSLAVSAILDNLPQE